MTIFRIPSPLRAYAGGQAEITVTGHNVAQALEDLIQQHPSLRQHLFNGNGELRPFVNLYLNSEDIHHLDGLATSLKPEDRLMIVPSIAGGNPSGMRKVDHSALRTNQAAIIGLTLLAFVLNQPWLAGAVALVMAIGTILRTPGFGFIYQRALKPAGLVKPDVLVDNPEPHRFAQGFGAVVLAFGAIALFAGAPLLGWVLAWVVIALAALNLFAGFCAGCAVYYWLNRLNVPGFIQSPPEGTFPGMRPKAKV
jgi:molybdopterin converting factor small subunit